jgi:MFS family permease
MAGGAVLSGNFPAANYVEAPITFKAYLMCAFASFGGIFFGYDSGYINGVLASPVFIQAIAPGQKAISSSHTSLIVSILSAGTFFGALIAGDCADMFGRRLTIITGCAIYLAGAVIEMSASSGLAVIVVSLPVSE